MVRANSFKFENGLIIVQVLLINIIGK